MKKISETELVTTCINDLEVLIPSKKNRSSFLNVEEGAKQGCSRIATLVGQKRVKRWMKMFLEKEMPFSKIAHLPVWDNGNGTYTLGDGHTRIDALKYLCKEKGLEVPNISLIIENSKFKTLEEFENEIIVLNGTFNGQKWDLCEKVDFLMRQGNENAKKIFDLFDYFYEKNNKDVAFNLVTNVFLDCQGSGKDNTILNELDKLKDPNKYAYDFADFFTQLNEKISNNKQEVKVNLYDQYLFQSMYDLFMCVAAKHHDKINTFFMALYGALSDETTKKNIIQSKKTSQMVSYILDRIGKNKKHGEEEWYKTMKLVQSPMGGMIHINERGGRCITIN